MSHEQFLNSPDDVKWMRDKLKSVKGLPRFKSYLLRGNEDVPDEVVLYREREPTIMDVPIAKIYHDGDGEPYMELKGFRSKHGESYDENPRTREIGRHVYDYESADKFLGGKDSRKLANNTTVRRDESRSAIHVRLHGTDIVTYYWGGAIRLNSGGYHTKTTKQRINELLPPGFSVSQKDYAWTVHTPLGVFPFEDGATLWPLSSFASKIYETKEQESRRFKQEHGYEKNSPRQPPKYGPGKFDGPVEELLHMIDHDDEVSYEDGEGWWGLVSGLLLPEAKEFVRENTDIDIHDFDEDARQYPWPMNAIVHEDSSGFVNVTAYSENREMMREWRRIQKEVTGSAY